MTTGGYRWAVAGQVTAMVVLGLTAVLVFDCAVPQYRVRRDLGKAIDRYSLGTESEVRVAQEALDRVVAVDERIPSALALRGRMGLEQNNLSVAFDAYEKLERVLADRGEPRAAALNGLGCAMLLDARNQGAKGRQRMEEAYAKLKEAVKEDPMNGDANVNAGICSLYLGRLAEAAGHLRDAGNTRRLGYESAVAYYSAVGLLFAEAWGRGGREKMAVADAFREALPELEKGPRMLVLAGEELDKAAELAQSERAAAELRAHSALAKARLLASSPPGRSEINNYWEFVSRVLEREKVRLPARERQLLCAILSLSYYASGYVDIALGFARGALAKREGELSAETAYYVGAALYECGQWAQRPQDRPGLEGQAKGCFLKALGEPGLAPHVRWRALGTLAAVEARANDVAGAAKHMEEAAVVLAGLEKEGAALGLTERSRFYRNLGILMYQTGSVGKAVAALRSSVQVEKSAAAAEFLAKVGEAPVIGEITTMTAGKLPPNMPIVTATVRSGGPVTVRKEDVSVKIDGDGVAFTCGPGGRIYALPRKPLAEGKHTAVVTVAAEGKEPVRQEKEFEVKYKYRVAGTPVRGG